MQLHDTVSLHYDFNVWANSSSPYTVTYYYYYNFFCQRRRHTKKSAKSIAKQRTHRDVLNGRAYFVVRQKIFTIMMEMIYSSDFINVKRKANFFAVTQCKCTEWFVNRCRRGARARHTLTQWTDRRQQYLCVSVIQSSMQMRASVQSVQTVSREAPCVYLLMNGKCLFHKTCALTGSHKGEKWVIYCRLTDAPESLPELQYILEFSCVLLQKLIVSVDWMRATKNIYIYFLFIKCNSVVSVFILDAIPSWRASLHQHRSPCRRVRRVTRDSVCLCKREHFLINLIYFN